MSDNNNNQNVWERMSINQIMRLLDDRENTFSSEDVSKIIDRLLGANSKKETVKEKKRQQEDRKRRERKAREAKARKAAHIKKVTGMELPLDWENAFIQDTRGQGVHVDSISDGLIACLSNLGRVDSETILAMEKQTKIIQAFRKWIWRDAERRERLETIFENKFSCVRRRIFDRSFLKLPQMSPAVHLYPYQKNAVARIIFTSNTLLAHEVGSGKTYIMIAAGMEMCRMDL